MQKAFVSSRQPFEDGRIISTLCQYDPEPVARYLLRWKASKANWRNEDRGYVMGSIFAHFCGKDREKYLRLLLQARDPYIRVAGAVYLYFENPQAGKKELHKLTKLKGNPGTWAALTLARRGEKSAMPRLLEIFASPLRMRGSMRTIQTDNLYLRVLELLSNSTAASGIPMPEPPDTSDLDHDAQVKVEHAYYMKWWQENKDKIIFTDPWLPVLDTQKID